MSGVVLDYEVFNERLRASGFDLDKVARPAVF